jgi:hypothetical protein
MAACRDLGFPRLRSTGLVGKFMDDVRAAGPVGVSVSHPAWPSCKVAGSQRPGQTMATLEYRRGANLLGALPPVLLA